MNADGGRTGEGHTPDDDVERTWIDPSASKPAPPPPRSAQDTPNPDATIQIDAPVDETLIQPAVEAGPLPEVPGVTLSVLIGQGGMGVVYEGVQTFLDRTVAVKLLHPRFRGGDFEKRFHREARILAGLTHPHIVACHQAGVTRAGDCYLVMEFIDGPSLRQWLDRPEPPSLAQSLAVCRDIANALMHAHRAGIIHRDVKPENILLQHDERAGAQSGFPFHAKLADLGLARPTVDDTDRLSLTEPGVVMGTPSTMAPEQFDDPDHVDWRADVYGLGCVLFHMITGELAFPQRTMSKLIAVKTSTSQPDPRRIRREVPREVSDLVRSMLATDLAERPKSYEELIARLDVLIPFVQQARARRMPKLWMMVAGVSVALAVAVGAWLSWPSGSRSTGEPLSGPEALVTVDPTTPSSARDGSTTDTKGSDVDPESARSDASPTPGASGPAASSAVTPPDESASTQGTAEPPTVATIHRPLQAPVLSGPTAVEAGELVILHAAHVDVDDPIAYEWILAAGPKVAAEDLHSSELRFVAPEATSPYELAWTLRVEQGNDRADSQRWLISVDADPKRRPLKPGEIVSLFEGMRDGQLPSSWESILKDGLLFQNSDRLDVITAESSSPVGAQSGILLRRGNWTLMGWIALGAAPSVPTAIPIGLLFETSGGAGTVLGLEYAEQRVHARTGKVVYDTNGGWTADAGTAVPNFSANLEQEIAFEARWNGRELTVALDHRPEPAWTVVLPTRPRRLSMYVRGDSLAGWIGALRLRGE